MPAANLLNVPAMMSTAIGGRWALGASDRETDRTVSTHQRRSRRDDDGEAAARAGGQARAPDT
jgi:hypothetical protein